MVDHIYSLRKEFMIIGLTGRTGSGCTTVANFLTEKDPQSFKSMYQNFRNGEINNQVRKDRIIYNFIQENWYPFIRLTASDIIFYYALLLPFSDFIKAVATCIEETNANKSLKEIKRIRTNGDAENKKEGNNRDGEIIKHVNNEFANYKDIYDVIHQKIIAVEEILSEKEYNWLDLIKGLEKADPKENYDELKQKIYNDIGEVCHLILKDLPYVRSQIQKIIDKIERGILPEILQQWGNKIRKYKTVLVEEGMESKEDAPSAIASKLNDIIKCIRKYNKLNGGNPTRVVIDALRNPFEILYFRERYSAFYCLSVNTTEDIRHNQLLKNKGFRMEEIIKLDDKEGEKKRLKESYQEIDVIKCIQLSDIYLSHDGTNPKNNRNLINQILTYISLILHPGLVPPTPEERIMQIAYTAKLNSGCLSRQVGAAVTDEHFSVKSIGWNSVPEGQVPCSLRQIDDLYKEEDPSAFSDYEKKDPEFSDYIVSLHAQYTDEKRSKLKGIGLSYCFKNIYTKIKPKQLYNQVHTRSLHAEENAFLQLVKYGSQGVEGGKLFTTASCCELCAKKAYHLGIKEIYYIDSYPGISNQHIFNNGVDTHRPKIILFSGAVGRAYINLYNPFLPLKDEIEALTDVEVGKKFGKKDK